ncbi:MAG: LamG domain-containing protein, partial [Desulfobacteraceae bacterium]|nr:LamG domain-containing protein [Desulfobacteraceae bacterium]
PNNHHGLHENAVWEKTDGLMISKPDEKGRPDIDISVEKPHDQFRTALGFDGDDFVQIPGFEWPIGENPVTVEFWLYVDQYRRSSAFSMGLCNNPNRFQFHPAYTDAKSYWDYGHTSYNGRVIVTQSDWYLLGRWTHFALVSYGNTSGLRAVYLNGGQNKVINQDSVGPVVKLTGLWLGKWLFSTFIGKLADFRIWNRVRPEVEIKRDMKRRLAGDEPGLAGYWPLNEGSGLKVYDHTPNQNHGDITGASWYKQNSDFAN